MPTSMTTTASAATDFCILMITGVGIGCTQESAPSTDSYCQLTEPFRWSPRDTGESKLQAKKINRRFKKLCPAEAAEALRQPR